VAGILIRPFTHWSPPKRRGEADQRRRRRYVHDLEALIYEHPDDIEDVLDEIAADNQLAESKGVELDADRASEPEAE